MSLLDGAPVFIVGAQRSGTTWLQRMLADHPAIVSGQESHLISGYLAPMWQRWQVEQQLRESGGRNVGLACYLSEEELLEQMRGIARSAFSHLERAKPEASILVEKTPDHGLYLALLHRLFPQATLLHIVRDGRDVAASLVHASQEEWGKSWAPATVAEGADRWRLWLTTIQESITLFDRQQTIRYEDLIEQGPLKLAEVFDYLKVPLPFAEVEQIHDRWRFELAPSQESLCAASEQSHCHSQEPNGFYRKGKAGGWQEDLSSMEQRQVIAVAGSLLKELGYIGQDQLDEHTDKDDGSRFVSTAPFDGVLWTRPLSVGIIDETNAQMLHRERLYLYATVLALAPERCLEIGVSEGGSTRILHAALADLGRGHLIALDPCLKLTYDLALLSDRVTFLEAPSPANLAKAMEMAEGLFDFVLLDGDHSFEGARNDLLGLSEVTKEGAIVLAHDAYYGPVASGLNHAMASGAPFLDAGIVSTTRHPGRQGDEQVDYAGFRLLIRQPQRGRMQRLARRLTHLFSR